jgi:hypothetical protein
MSSRRPAPGDGPVYHIEVRDSQNTVINLPHPIPPKKGLWERLGAFVTWLVGTVAALFRAGG